MRRGLLASVVLTALSAWPLSAAETLSYTDLVKRLTDLERLAVLPVPGERAAQCSSYDRASRWDAAAGKHVAWDANGDGGGIIRREGDQSVIAEMTGPGCIWRIWSAKADQGHVRIYLDGATTPAVDLPFAGYFDGKNAPFTYPSLVHNAASGINSYVPIPFQTSCKVTADNGWGQYYHFTYSTFPAGTQVPTFRRELSAEELAALAAADQALTAGLGKDPAGDRPQQAVTTKRLSLTAGQSGVLLDVAGPAAVTRLQVKLDAAAGQDVATLLRSVVLRMNWDGEAAPSVWTPLGDFFGSAPGINLYRSLPLGMTEDGFYSLWYMPFAEHATVSLRNEGTETCTLEATLTTAPLARPAADLGRFHAKWHRDAFLPEAAERWIDWPMFMTRGRGRFCGVMLHVWNPRGGWWGEGDEKFWVDGEPFPSTFGTGSEDYFGYAWCNPTLFQNAFHNQTISNGNKGHVSVNRWHITDNVPFQTEFEADIEKYYPNKRPTLYACTAYWYQAVGGQDPYAAVPIADRVGYAIPVAARKVAGAVEGESLRVLSVSAGNPHRQELDGHGDGWSDDAHLWWTDAKPGDTLVLAVPVKDAGRYKLTTQLTKARDYGIVQLGLDDTKLGGPIDLYDPNVVPTGVLDLGVHELTAGEHRFTVQITGANDAAVKAFMFGVDYLLLERQK